MRWRGDSSGEMHRRQDIGDAAIEAFFTGNGAGDEVPPSLAALAEELRDMAVGPAPQPSPLLAVLLQQGFSTENGDPSATAASNVPGPAQQAAGLPKWRRRRMVIGEFLAGLSVAAKATFGVGVAMASVTAAGAAGALPGAVQNVVATGIEAVTPFDLPDSGDLSDDGSGQDVTGEDAGDVGGDDAGDVVGDGSGEPTGDGAGAGGRFGDRVSADAQDGGVDGREISEEAKLNGEANRADAAADAGRPESPGDNGQDRGNAPAPVPAEKPDKGPATTVPDGDDGSGDDDPADEDPPGDDPAGDESGDDLPTDSSGEAPGDRGGRRP